MNYSERLTLLHALLSAETLRADEAAPDLKQFNALDAADYLSCFLTFKAIQLSERSPMTERSENFDMLSVYQTYALLLYAFLSLPLRHEQIEPNIQHAQIVIAKTLFSGLPDAELAEIIESGFNKFKLIADAEVEHWADYREALDKATISFIVAGTDDDAPHSKDDILPLFGQLLSQLCEAFEAA